MAVNGPSKRDPENLPRITIAKVSKADMEQVNEICDWLYDAIDGLGTDNIGFERAFLKIEKNNVIEIMNKWDSTYGKQYGESFVLCFLHRCPYPQALPMQMVITRPRMCSPFILRCTLKSLRSKMSASSAMK